jgi:hypothetical protein
MVSEVTKMFSAELISYFKYIFIIIELLILFLWKNFLKKTNEFWTYMLMTR